VPLPRSIEVFLSAAALVMGAPLWATIAIAIKLSSPGPVLFRQDRVGREGRVFEILKFRTMQDVHFSQLLTVGDRDPRVTRVGALLRRCKMDEIPQLINVVKGDMSLVGPRPEVPKYVSMDDELHRAVLVARPGLTDPASIVFRNESQILAAASDPDRYYRERILPRKLKISRAYLDTRSSRSDVGVIGKTLRKAVFRA
jgi:lipopolysaccharide/colanic/teichoic acid biosynthesis glycosyltransferase